MLERYEVRDGLVLRMDPGRLLAAGIIPTGPTRFRADGPHYFVCVGVHRGMSDWIACSSKWSPDRLKVRRKWGDSDWVRSDTWADPYQVWTGAHNDLRYAALGIDRSTRGSRNFASLEFLDELAIAA
jgi:hypothetical protein